MTIQEEEEDVTIPLVERTPRKYRRTMCKRRDVELVTPLGTLQGRYQIKAAVQSAAFACLISGYGVFHYFSNNGGEESSSAAAGSDFRLLQAGNGTDDELSDNLCSDLSIADPSWLCVFYAIGVLYMFLALAIACDEFFVPALEEMSGPHRLDLSMDVAGATLMAAGGSAPELFTSLFGTFQENAIGFGTIVGSAVFNVLFVIAMCSLLAKETLTLTWWPLFRDSTYYAIGLVVLAIFTGVTSEGVIEIWEAVVLFIMYLGYIVLMWQNANLYKLLTGKVLEYPEDDDEDGDEEKKEEATNGATNSDANGEANGNEPVEDRRDALTGRRSSSQRSILSNLSATAQEAQGGGGHTPHFRWQGTFRAGILKLLKDPETWLDIAGMGIVAKIAGDADYVFQQVDIDGNGTVDRDELRQLFIRLECDISETELEEVFNQLDENNDGVISRQEFTEWYCQSEERVLSQVRHVFDRIDANHSNTIDADELKKLLAMLDPQITDDEVQAALESMYQHGSKEEITFDEFQAWYRKSIVFERQRKLIEEDMGGVWENLYPPKDGSCLEWAWYIIVLPLVAVMTFTIPDVQRPGMGGWCYLSFFISIAWIGGFSYLMVIWAEIIGNTIGIPPVIMGLTVLAAGTSVPDLLSSVIVARRGNGDMAVSSSIGSNIFDILVGLPIPWLIFTVWPNDKDTIDVGAGNIFIFLVVLLSMLVFVIAAVHCQGWQLTKKLGGIMILLYIGFLVFAILIELPFEKCDE